MKKIKYTHDALKYMGDDYNEDAHIMLESKKVVCYSCNGEGTTFRRDLDSSRMYDMMIEDGDYEGIEEMRSGAYNETCRTCKGKNVVDEIDWEDAYKKYPKEVKAIEDWNRQEAEDARYAAQERAFCGGGW